MRSKLIVVGVSLSICVVFSGPAFAQSLSSNLKPIEKLLHKKWVGMLKAPDGSAEWRTTREYITNSTGMIVNVNESTPDRNSSGEGFFYWDSDQKKIAFFMINERGIVTQGTVNSREDGFEVEGTITFPDRKFSFRNTFEFTSDGKMIDRWFQNAFGDWRAGHVITFEAEKETR
jgi:hypothetical protein